KLGNAAPLLPAMAVNAASIVAEIAAGPSPNAKVGLFLRPCELRAVVELMKLRQILPDSIVLIGVDCPGTYKAAGFRDIRGKDEDFDNKHVREQSGYADNVNFRTGCQLCEFPRPLVYDLAVGYIGMDPDNELWLEAATDKGRALLEGVDLKAGDEPDKRKQALAGLSEKRKAATAKRLAELDRAVMGPDNLVRYFADCLNCHNCMKVCPVCYCRECFFDSATFQRDLGEHVRISLRKGLTRMPSETLLFHITRMNHMMTSCVQCGICEDSCPVTIGLATLFKKVSQNAQQEFEYLSGRSLDEPLPLTAFREDEFRKVGEE
ncbi:hypothetical protein FJY71_08770, partial [candidate division WOR-3 bacterium]|nr:hypothetical protein [candidate division WOR-3 bacterium]